MSTQDRTEDYDGLESACYRLAEHMVVIPRDQEVTMVVVKLPATRSVSERYTLCLVAAAHDGSERTRYHLGVFQDWHVLYAIRTGGNLVDQWLIRPPFSAQKEELRQLIRTRIVPVDWRLAPDDVLDERVAVIRLNSKFVEAILEYYRIIKADRTRSMV